MDGIAVTFGIGLTTMVTFTGFPAHPPLVGVIVYTAVPVELPVDKTCIIKDPLPAEAPVTPPVCTTVQAKVVPGILLVNDKFVVFPAHIDCDAGVTISTGAELTVTVTDAQVVVLQVPCANT